MRKKYCLLVVVLLALASPPVWSVRSNQLYNHASPYLAMHGRDPVQWQEWGGAAQQAAQEEDKLLFVSSGYFSCHWCHVMQRESYSDPEIARLLNEHFIPVKVDRELNPALDARLIDFVERTRGHAGWPLNVFITPEGYPLVGFVYLPAADFKSFLQQLAQQWQQKKTELKQLARDATAELMQPVERAAEKSPLKSGRDYTKLLLDQVFRFTDDLQGGFGQQNKFPSVPQLSVLLSIQQQQADASLQRFLVLTMDQMASQGLYDHLGGGFFRYTVDPAWQTPHFEKMLYDNALLARLYLEAATVLKQPAYLEVAYETLDFILRDLATADGAFAASLSAVDDKGVEGGGYLWDAARLQRLLTPEEWQLIRQIWGIEGTPQAEAGHHLRQAMSLEKAASRLGLKVEKARNLLASAKRKMRQQRRQRRVPRDDKRLAAWNGLTLTALVQAVETGGEKKYRLAAKRLRDYLANVLWQGDHLQRAVASDSSLGQAGLEDYAFVAEGLFNWARLSREKADFELAVKIARTAWQRFYTEQGWQLAAPGWFKYGTAEPLIADGVMPSPSAVLLAISYRMAKQSGDKAWQQRILAAARAGDALIREAPFWHATQIRLLSRIIP